MITIDGLATGLDTTAIIEGLLSIRQRQIDRLTANKDEVVAEQSAFKGIEARVVSLQTRVAALARIHDSVFDAKTVSSSDETILKAAASEDAVVGAYALRVSEIARAHSIAAQGFADTDGIITQGTLDLRVGNGAATTISIDGTNNTLQGLADAINNSDAAVSATIINDGSESTPFRLILTANETGVANTISITNNLAASGGGATKPDFTTTVQSATDASVTIGSGQGAISISSGSNQIEDVVPGVTLDLFSADPTKDITLNVASDTESAKTAITDFVDSFNELMKFVDEQVRFDPETEEAGPLLGNRSVTVIQDEIRSAVTDVVAGVHSDMNRLSALGISVNGSGRLSVDTSKLDAALAGNVDGTTLNDIHRLFALDGITDNGGVTFVLGSTRTKESAYQVDIRQAAERASIAATNELAASTVVDASNDTFTITVDGKLSETLTLTHGTYTRQQLADHLESVINSESSLAGRQVSVSLSNNRLVVTSDVFGSSSQVAIGTGNALAALGFDGTEQDTGQDVVGAYLVDGVEETATGTGRLLIGTAENENTADLQVRVTLTQSQVQSGADANLTVTRGIAARLDQILSSVLDPVTGRIKAINDSFDGEIESIEASIERQNEFFEAQQQSLVAQFVALESTISELQSTGNFLAAQLAAIGSLTRNNQNQ